MDWMIGEPITDRVARMLAAATDPETETGNVGRTKDETKFPERESAPLISRESGGTNLAA